MCLVGCRFAKGRVWPLAIVEVHPLVDDALGCKAVGDILQVDSLVFERAPQAFDKDVIQVAPASIHADAHACIGQRSDPVCPGKLTSLDALLNVKQRFVPDLSASVVAQ
jgi:hypothetical protein